jgi:glycogen debranching enzyme
VSAAARRAPSVLRALESILSPTGFPYASNGVLFKDGQFGRDALETAEDLLQIRPDIARAVIRRLAELQGTRVDTTIGEEPGKIHHEYRALVRDGRTVNGESVRIFHDLAEEWHVSETTDEPARNELISYFTVDATPHYVRLAARYCRRYGEGILDETYVPRHAGRNHKRSIRDSVRAAGAWVARKVEESDIGLLEWCRKTPWEHRFQAWKDGATSYLHEDGSFANYDGPMASVEVQGLAYDALRAAGELFPKDPCSRRYADLAAALREVTLRNMWMPEHDSFAMALDRDPHTGAVRQVSILTSNGAAVLDSGLFDGLSLAERRRYIEAVVRHVFGDEFLTPAGIRCTALRHKDLQDYPAYQSSYTIWHKETYDIAKGLRQQGLTRLAAELETRLLNTVNLAGPKEFIYVLPDNRVDCGPVAGLVPGETIEFAATNLPENDQAWTVAAAVAIKWRIGRRSSDEPPDRHWGRELEEELLRRIGETKLFRTLADIERARPTEYAIRVNTEKGWERERAWTAARLLSPHPPTPSPNGRPQDVPTGEGEMA